MFVITKRVRLLLGVSVIGAMSLISATGSLLSAQQLGPQTDRVDVLIGFRTTPTSADEDIVRAAGGQVRHRFHLVPAIAASVPRAAVEGLQRNPRVTVVEPDGQVFMTDEYDNAWGVARIGSESLHATGVRGTGIKVAVLDTGIAYAHPDLAANYAGGRDFVNNDNDPNDDNNHGSHVAGTIAAVLNGTGVVGVAPEARLYGVKVLNASGSGSWSGIIAGVQWVVDNGIKITNNSYGSSSNPGSIVEAAYANSAAAGVLHIASAGNSGTCAGNTDTVGYPAKFASVVAVAATQPNDARPCFSSTGPTVELAAPGVSVVSTVRNGQYSSFSGTSMASPHAAGLAALVWGAAGTTTAAEVRQILQSTAIDIGNAGRDTFYGFGLIDAVAAVAAVNPGTPADPEVNVALTTDKSNYVQGTDTSVVLTAVVTDEDGAPITNIGVANFSTTLDGNPVSATFTQSPAASGVYIAGLSLSGMGVGAHNANVSVTDNGVSGQDGAPFTVSAASSNTVQVPSIVYSTYGGKGNNRHLLITVRVVDGNNVVVPNAAVGVSITRNGSGIGSSSGTTGANGQVTFEIKNHAAGCYRTTVTSVSAGTSTWNGVTPSNGSAGCGG